VKTSSKRALWSGTLLVVVALLLGVFVMRGLTRSIDATIFSAMVLSQASSPWLVVSGAKVVTSLGDPGIRAVILTGGLAMLIVRRCWRPALVFLTVPTLSLVGHSVAKEFFGRARPNLGPALDSVNTFSYPSGHAAGSMVVLLLGALLLGNRTLVWLAFALSLAIGMTRVMLGVHWPSDVAGGWLFGGGTALIGFALANGAKQPHRHARASKGI
jgi:undecaprenyl-diphosphatase